MEQGRNQHHVDSGDGGIQLEESEGVVAIKITVSHHSSTSYHPSSLVTQREKTDSGESLLWQSDNKVFVGYPTWMFASCVLAFLNVEKTSIQT